MKKTKAKNKKISIIFIMLILIMSVSIGLYATEPETTDIVCADVNLYDALVEDLDDYVYRADRTTKTIRIPTTNIPLITELKLTGNSSAKITDLTGLEYFTSLENLNLSGNSITSVEPISGLTTLKTLNISTNQATITDLATLSNLTNLVDVNFASSRLANVDFMSTYTQLQVLDVSGNTISSLDPLVGITTLKKLNIANNASFNRFQTNICNHTGLTYLDISGTAIQVLDGIETNLRNLETLNLRYLDVELDPIVAKYKETTESEDYVAYLNNLKVLDISYTTKSISFKNLSYLTGLTHLYMKDVVGKWNNPTTSTKLSLSGIYELQGLQYINLASNNISSIEDFVYEKYDENILVEKKVLGATEIYLQDNNISDITRLIKLNHPIKILNLSYNKISETSPLDNCNFTSDAQVDLRYQEVSLKVFKKASVDQYIILPSIFQHSKTEGSFIYSEDTDFLIKCNDEVDEESIRLNKEEIYLEPGNLNVIISKSKTTDDVLTLEITGTSMATGSKITFELGTSSGNVDSIFFKDPNLCQAIKDNLAQEEYAGKVKYVKNAHLIMNINNSAIKAIDRLHLASKNISDLSGMENFTGLTNLILSNNAITTIDPLQYCTKMLNLEVPNNNLGDNNTAITQMTKIQQLDLSNTNMTNIESIHTLIDYWTRKKSFPLTNLKLSGNGFTNEQLQRISEITSLTTLIVANNELNEVESFENLKSNISILDVSQNAIEDISTLSSFTNLISLNLSNNKIKDISPIANCAKLNELDFSANRIENISSLSSIAGSGNLVILNMNNNKIQDVSAVDRDQISQTLSAESQKIALVIPEGTEGSMTIELPQIFKIANDANSRFYDNGKGARISVVNKADGVEISEYCTLSSDKSSIFVNVDKLADNNIIVLKLQDGNADNTTLSIGAPLKGTITYNPSNETLTNQDVTATITFNRTATVINNDGKNTYTFTENGEFTFEYVDEYGFEGTAVAKVENIDKVAPQGTVSQKLEDGKVVVTIEVNEEIAELEGWEKTTTEEGKIILTKTYEDDSNETIKLVDLAGNESEVKVEVKFDKTAPTITGVEDGEKYEISVTPVIEDENLSEITLTKDEVAIEGYQSGTEITESGNYVLTAKDTYGNTTTVSFEIELDQVAPTITGVEDGEKYEISVTPVIEDKNLSEVILTKNGTVVENYQSGTEITESGKYVLTAKDKSGNTTTVSFEIEIPQEISDKITSDEVTVNEEETRIEDINPEIIVSQLKEKLNAEMDYEIVDKNGNAVSETSKIGTGYKVKMSNDKTYTIIVSGDCNGDGSVKLSDMSLVNRYRLNKTTLEGEYFLAADVTGDGKVDFKDLVKINRFRLNKITEL